MIHESISLERAKINLETAQIPWHDLQRFFASGTAIFVAPELDLLATAEMFALDQAPQIKNYLEQQQVGKVSDAQALAWYEQNTVVWAVVVKPWVLVQAPAATPVTAAIPDHT